MEATKSKEPDDVMSATPTHRGPRLLEFVRMVVREEKTYKRGERRAHLRYPVCMSIYATPLDDYQNPIAESFYAVARELSIAGSFTALSRDISVGGISMYHTRPVKEKYLHLELTAPNGEQLDMNLEVLRCRKAGPFYEIAGRFVGDSEDR